MDGEAEPRERMDAYPWCCLGAVRCVVEALRIRAGPGLGWRVVGYLAKGERADVWAMEDGWLLVQTDRVTGYAWGEYLEYEA